jgi:hypothetical protein
MNIKLDASAFDHYIRGQFELTKHILSDLVHYPTGQKKPELSDFCDTF